MHSAVFNRNRGQSLLTFMKNVIITKSTAAPCTLFRQFNYSVFSILYIRITARAQSGVRTEHNIHVGAKLEVYFIFSIGAEFAELFPLTCVIHFSGDLLFRCDRSCSAMA